jgi:hypothetical protein
MQFLIRAHPKPCARKIKGRSRNLFEQKHRPIELATPFHLSNVKRNVI